MENACVVKYKGIKVVVQAHDNRPPVVRITVPAGGNTYAESIPITLMPDYQGMSIMVFDRLFAVVDTFHMHDEIPHLMVDPYSCEEDPDGHLRIYQDCTIWEEGA